MDYHLIKRKVEVLAKMLTSSEFRRQRREFIRRRDWDYDTIRTLRDDFFDTEAKKREKILIEREKYFGLKHDESLYDRSVVLMEVP